MRVINIHKRTFHQPKEKIAIIFETLGTEADKFWPTEKWPPMRFKEKIKIGAKASHAGIRYFVNHFIEKEYIVFKFTQPIGFIGTHELRIKAIDKNQTEITHEIKMNTINLDTLYWVLIVRWLHDALLEDAFDKIENYFSKEKKETRYNIWVRLLRTFYKMKTKQFK